LLSLHAPEARAANDTAGIARGVGCTSCHADHTRAAAEPRTSSCGTCHEFTFPGRAAVMQSTMTELHALGFVSGDTRKNVVRTLEAGKVRELPLPEGNVSVAGTRPHLVAVVRDASAKVLRIREKVEPVDVPSAPTIARALAPNGDVWILTQSRHVLIAKQDGAVTDTTLPPPGGRAAEGKRPARGPRALVPAGTTSRRYVRCYPHDPEPRKRLVADTNDPSPRSRGHARTTQINVRHRAHVGRERGSAYCSPRNIMRSSIIMLAALSCVLLGACTAADGEETGDAESAMHAESRVPEGEACDDIEQKCELHLTCLDANRRPVGRIGSARKGECGRPRCLGQYRCIQWKPGGQRGGDYVGGFCVEKGCDMAGCNCVREPE
jgi:hypothetical protein